MLEARETASAADVRARFDQLRRTPAERFLVAVASGSGSDDTADAVDDDTADVGACDGDARVV
ncbi:hypothetical protein [Haloprofundus halobius]|uniref:hypothetical protein n=1 Tax=Haloprofundus halobius TaxID=2876194 RepID=UPI001CCC0BFF|nr:hypothetical protein [Haloprofundus halobius]